MLIAIDHGNKNIKTAHHIFTSGLTESEARPPFGDAVLQVGGKYYMLSEQRIPYLRDKRVCPKICVNTIIGANRAILIQGGSRGIRLPSCLQHNAGGAGCQGRRSRLITLDIRARRCYSGMRSAK